MDLLTKALTEASIKQYIKDEGLKGEKGDKGDKGDPGDVSIAQLNDLKEDLSESTTYYNEEPIAVSASPEGWRLDGTGKCVEATAYKLVKYEVTSGDTLHLVLSKDVTGSEAEGVYQWQNTVGVPSNLPNTGLIGTPVSEAVDGYFVVPSGATYLIVSQFKTNTSNHVGLVTDSTSIKEKVLELDEKVDSIEPGLSADAKEALLNCFAHSTWIDEHGQDYYDALYAALYGIQPDPDVPVAYTRYDHIRLKRYSEAPNVYTQGGADKVSAGTNDGLNPLIATSAYSDLNQLNIKFTVEIITPTVAISSGSPNSCAFGGGISSDAVSRFGTYWHTGKQWIYCMAHGVERQFQQALQDINTFEFINGNGSPSTLKINGTSHSFEWQNSNVINSPISYFMSTNFSTVSETAYFFAGTYTKVGVIEFKNQSGTLISKLIPVVRKADNVIGIWDSIRKEFYTARLSKYATIGNASCIYDVGNWE